MAIPFGCGVFDMAAGQKIKAICDIDFLKSPHCSYLSEAEKEEILNDYAVKTCLVVGFVCEDSELFVAVYDITPASLHVRHVVGNFGRHYRELDVFSQALAKMCGYNQVTFCTKRAAVMKWAKAAEYCPTNIDFHFMKQLG